MRVIYQITIEDQEKVKYLDDFLADNDIEHVRTPGNQRTRDEACDNFHSTNEYCQGCGFLKSMHK